MRRLGLVFSSIVGWAFVVVGASAQEQSGSAAPQANEEGQYAGYYPAPADSSDAYQIPDPAVLEDICAGGDANACKQLGDAFANGLGVPQVDTIAEALYKEACEASALGACRELGDLYSRSSIEGKDLRDASNAYQSGCNQADLSACANWASLLNNGEAGIEDKQRAKLIVGDACAQNSHDSCRMLASFLVHEGNGESDEARAMDIWSRLCFEGDENSCGNAIETLKRDPLHDDGRLLELQFVSCNAGYLGGCLAAAERAYLGIGMQMHRTHAIQLLDRACELESWTCDMAPDARNLPQWSIQCTDGDRESCTILGEVLAKGGRPYSNEKLALNLLSDACLSDQSRACAQAALLHAARKGDKSRLDAAMALALRTRACDAQDLNSCLILSEWYETGKHVLERDLQKASDLLTPFCEGGDALICEWQQRFAGILPEIPLAAADTSFVPPDFDAESALLQQDGTESEHEGSQPATNCVVYEVEFRGEIHSQTRCPSTEYAINSRKMNPGDAPWQALLWRPEVVGNQRLTGAQRVACGGSVVARGWVLTAAHCLDDLGNDVASDGYQIRLGVYNPRNNEGVSYPIIDAIPHKDYKRLGLAFDVALIRYDFNAGVRLGDTNSIKRISLDPRPIKGRGAREVTDGMDVYSYGWGWTEFTGSQSTDYLQGVTMQLSNQQACDEITNYRGERENAVLCAGGAQGEQTCFGDSGGGLIYYGDGTGPLLIGVVSNGTKCGTTGVNSRYPRIANVKDWIEQTMETPRNR